MHAITSSSTQLEKRSSHSLSLPWWSTELLSWQFFRPQPICQLQTMSSWPKSCRAFLQNTLLFPPSLTWISPFKIPIWVILNSVAKDLFPANCWIHLADTVLKRNHMNLLCFSSSSSSSPLPACHLWGFQHASKLLLHQSQNVTWLVSSATRHGSMSRADIFLNAPWCCLYLLLCFRSQPLKTIFPFIVSWNNSCWGTAPLEPAVAAIAQTMRTLFLIKSEWGLVAEEERAVTLIHEHYPLSFPHPFSTKVDARPLSNIFMRDTHTPLFPCVFTPAAVSREEKVPALLG